MTRRCKWSSSLFPATEAVGVNCLIIAAGKGSRLRSKQDGKPLIRILGVPLIERVIRSAKAGGADEFIVVTGYGSERLSAFLEALGHRLAVPITTVFNERWEQENGLSVLRAQNHLTAPFLLLMADHLFDPAIVLNMSGAAPVAGKILLGVDGDLNNPCVDLQDVTRVWVEGGKILRIGKHLTPHNAFDTGLFLCTPAIFAAIERSAAACGDTTLSGGVRMLAAEGKANAFDLTGQFWIDVDDPAAFGRAESALLRRLVYKPNDGPVARYLNRPISVRISRRLVELPVSPNQISLFSFCCSLFAAGLFAVGGYPALAAGGLLAQFASVIDGCDGEVARLKYQCSDYGGWFDAILDRYADACLLFGLTWHVFSVTGGHWAFVVGFAAVVGSFLNSYTADKYDGLMARKLGGRPHFRLGRDVRVFVVFLAAVVNLPLVALGAIAIVMNLEVVRRIVLCARAEDA